MARLKNTTTKFWPIKMMRWLEHLQRKQDSRKDSQEKEGLWLTFWQILSTILFMLSESCINSGFPFTSTLISKFPSAISVMESVIWLIPRTIFSNHRKNCPDKFPDEPFERFHAGNQRYVPRDWKNYRWSAFSNVSPEIRFKSVHTSLIFWIKTRLLSTSSFCRKSAICPWRLKKLSMKLIPLHSRPICFP